VTKRGKRHHDDESAPRVARILKRQAKRALGLVEEALLEVEKTGQVMGILPGLPRGRKR